MSNQHLSMRWQYSHPRPKSVTTANKILIVAILALHACMLAWSATRHSPTIDEPAHLAAGLSHWFLGETDLYAVNPPLVRAVAAIPVILLQPKLNWKEFEPIERRRSEFRVGRDFVRANGERTFWLTTVARWACIPFSLIGAWVCYQWSSELFGYRSGLAALTIWCASPAMLAYGALITPDVPSATFTILSTYLFCRWLKQGGWPATWEAGLAFGVACLTKASSILLPLVWLILLAVHFAARSDSSRPLRKATQFATLILIGIIVLNLGYGFDSTFKRLGTFTFVSNTLGGDQNHQELMCKNRFATSILGELPVPLPANFVLGLDRQKFDFERGLQKYFFGIKDDSPKGWRTFYITLLLIKVPIGFLLLFVYSTIFLCTSVNSRLMMVILPPACILAFVSTQSGLAYYRYLMPAFPFLIIWCSGAFSTSMPWTSPRMFVPGVFLLAGVTGSLHVFPHSLSFFNAIAGGPDNGRFYAVDSNFDWGQDLLYLKEWIHRHPEVGTMDAVLFSQLDFDSIGLDVQPLGEDGNNELDSEFVAISATMLARNGGVDRNEPALLVQETSWTKLLKQEPFAKVGYTIHIFRGPIE